MTPALADVEKALTLQPQYAEAYLNKGNVCGLLKRYDEAIEAYDKALALKSPLAEAWFGREMSCGSLSATMRHLQHTIRHSR